jgi:hypothetical protein
MPDKEGEGMTGRAHIAASVVIKAVLYSLMLFVMVWGIQIKLARYTPSSSATINSATATRLVAERHSAPNAQALIDHQVAAAQITTATTELHLAAEFHGSPIPAFTFALQQVHLSLSGYCGYDLAGPHLLNLPPPTLA